MMDDLATVDEYESLAEWCARRGGTGAVLPHGTSASVIELIEADVAAFERRVREYAYGIAMESVHPRDAQEFSL